MASITSSSTIADVKAVYLDNLSYSTDSSSTKAKAFIEACRAILGWPNKSAQDGAATEFDMEQIAAQLTDAERWLSSNVTSGFGTVKHCDFSGFRS